MLVLGCILKTLFPCLALQNQIVSASPLQLILLASTGHRQQQEDEDLDEYQAGPTGWSCRNCRCLLPPTVIYVILTGSVTQ